MADRNIYDVIIIGGGPAGLTAGLYTSRARLNSLLIEKGITGGQINNTNWIENYPGFLESIDGFELGNLMLQQATKFGLEITTAEVTGVEVNDEIKTVNTTEGDFSAKTLIIAGGSKRNKLDVPGEEEYSGRGVSYCATCDAPLFSGKPVAVVGGSDSAVTEALHLAEFASKVVLIHRRDELRAVGITRERVMADERVEILWNSTVGAVEGDVFVEKLKLNNVTTGEKSTLEVSGLFVSIGFQPDTEYLKGVVSLDPVGHIITNEKMETDVPGVFAAGDIRVNSAKQAITAAGDGATAAVYAQRYLTGQ
jgi:thioredoxin reductase (NADPH)